ncbi:MAG TPA: lipid-A-disaccharide synthase [Phycisphaerae bacterium]|nr:lipid-A-disaccharide synthase [Phycisphaerae bacterium]HRY67937.1 lipid-A-disaccharide synthase [Phycisphaerae bacterium]HSA26674.1 lipid-A-disaccharide synthase [Phycisphaerae bacterium]
MTLTTSSPRQPARIFISAAEPSADRHAASLVSRILQLSTDAQVTGVAGPLTQAAGCTAIEDWTAQATMLVGAVRLARRAFKLIGRVGQLMAQQPANLAILVDSPALHLPMAKRIQATGCPVLYYIAPQLWAWAPWRIRRVRRRVDRLAAILPFEENYFRSRGVDATFVGHPLVEQLSQARPDPATVAEYRKSGSPVIACLPGSRAHVIEEVLPGQIEIAHTIAAQYPESVFLFAAANPTAAQRIQASVSAARLNTRVQTDHNAEILSAADFALCASGTATLEVAWHRVPMVVMYNGSKWGYRLAGRWLIQTPHLCLVNILAGRRIVPEFMPYYTSTKPIAAEALDILGKPPRAASMRQDLDAVIRSLGTTSAAEQTARIALQMIAARRPQ